MTCKAITLENVRCSRNPLITGYCKQHDQAEKIKMYKKELAKMHQRVRKYLEITNDLTSRINDIKKLDYYKAELIKIGGANRPFRAIIDNPFHKDDVEKLFGMDIALVLDHYNELLNRRNSLVHPYTMDGMNGLRTKRIYI